MPISTASTGSRTRRPQQDPKAIREAAQQFESLFTAMMLKSMREANLGRGAGRQPGDEHCTRTCTTSRLAVQMSQGKGLGLAEMLVQQLTRSGLKGATPASGVEAGAAQAPSTPPSSVPHAQLGFVQRVQPLADEAAQLGGSRPTR